MVNIFKDKLLDMKLGEYLTNNQDGMRLVTSSPMFNLIALNNITQAEREAINRSFTIGYVLINKIPFLTFDFGNNFTFDSCIFNIEATSEDENAMILLLVEQTTKRVLEVRNIGLTKRFIELLIRDTKSIDFSKEEFASRVEEIQAKYSTNELIAMCKELQQF
ncbi:MAG: hypothetical protein WC141_10120 [Arcobacteraceae bacterium]